MAISNGHQQVKLGEWVVPAEMKDVFVDNTEEYRQRYANPKPAGYQVQMTFFRQLMHDLNARGCTVVVVSMPTLPGNRGLLAPAFWNDFRGSLQSVCLQNNSHLFDFSEDADFQKHDYVDTVHLNGRGGLKFFDKLAATISGDNKLVASLASASTLSEKVEQSSRDVEQSKTY